ncbi:MAG: anti-sigma factor [Kofleriaceae bacterium]
MLSCRDVTELVTDYVEGAMPYGERVSLWIHLAMCRHCRAYLRQYRDTIATLGHLPNDAPPPECRDELLRRFRDRKQ